MNSSLARPHAARPGHDHLQFRVAVGALDRADCEPAARTGGFARSAAGRGVRRLRSATAPLTHRPAPPGCEPRCCDRLLRSRCCSRSAGSGQAPKRPPTRARSTGSVRSTMRWPSPKGEPAAGAVPGRQHGRRERRRPHRARGVHRPAFVALTRRCVCLGASCSAQRARHDDQGHRIPVRRLTRDHCGEHLALEPICSRGTERRATRGRRHACAATAGGVRLSLCFDLLTSTGAGAAWGRGNQAPTRSTR